MKPARWSIRCWILLGWISFQFEIIINLPEVSYSQPPKIMRGRATRLTLRVETAKRSGISEVVATSHKTVWASIVDFSNGFVKLEPTETLRFWSWKLVRRQCVNDTKTFLSFSFGSGVGIFWTIVTWVRKSKGSMRERYAMGCNFFLKFYY